MKFFAPAILASLVAGAVAIPHYPLHLRSNNSSTEVGQKILATAMTAKGIPYAWGGGSCSGPTGDQPPYEYGDVGYDCSGLVCWAVCKATGRDLFTEGLRVTSSMYCASESTLGYKYVSVSVPYKKQVLTCSFQLKEVPLLPTPCRRFYLLRWRVRLQR